MSKAKRPVLKGAVDPLQLLYNTANCSGCSCSGAGGGGGGGFGGPATVIGILLKDTHMYSKSKKFFVNKIEAYQKLVDPKLKKALGVKKICRYTPTCSNYGKQAIKKYGNVKGIAKTAWRIARCNPFSKGGCDPVR